MDSLPWTHSTGYPGPQAADNRFQSELGNRVSALSLHDNLLMLDPILTALTIPSPDIEPFKGDIENYRMFVAALETWCLWQMRPLELSGHLLARVVGLSESSDGLVRSVRLRLRDSDLVRPVHKCVLLVES